MPIYVTTVHLKAAFDVNSEFECEAVNRLISHTVHERQLIECRQQRILLFFSMPLLCAYDLTIVHYIVC